MVSQLSGNIFIGLNFFFINASDFRHRFYLNFFLFGIKDQALFRDAANSISVFLIYLLSG